MIGLVTCQAQMCIQLKTTNQKWDKLFAGKKGRAKRVNLVLHQYLKKI